MTKLFSSFFNQRHQENDKMQNSSDDDTQFFIIFFILEIIHNLNIYGSFNVWTFVTVAKLITNFESVNTNKKYEKNCM